MGTEFIAYNRDRIERKIYLPHRFFTLSVPSYGVTPRKTVKGGSYDVTFSDS